MRRENKPSHVWYAVKIYFVVKKYVILEIR